MLKSKCGADSACRCKSQSDQVRLAPTAKRRRRSEATQAHRRQRAGHQLDEVVQVDEVILEAVAGAVIEDTPQPVHDHDMPFRSLEIGVISEPKIEMMADADIDRDERSAKRKRARR